jgi:methylamine---glutamate N-methyltransferase subunit B
MESDGGPTMAAAPPIVVPELRDYAQINAELVRRLNLGQRRVQLEGVENQRLLVSRLSGPWQAVVEIDGNAGPELAAELNAPGLIVVCRGTAADGAGRGLVAGRLVIVRNCGTALGYFQEGGLIVTRGDVGPRAGLNQKGGSLVLLGRAGALAGERQTGGRLFVRPALAGNHLGFGVRGGRRIDLPASEHLPADLDPDDRRLLEEAVELVHRFGSRT